MRVVRVNLAAWQPPSSCACCLQGTSNRVALSPRGIDIRRATPSLPLPLCPACREHVLFEQRGGETRITLLTILGMGVGAFLGGGAGMLIPRPMPVPAFAAVALGTALGLLLGLVSRRWASRSRPYELLDKAHTRGATPVEMVVEGTQASLSIHSDVFARLVADAHTPRADTAAPWTR